MYEKLIDKLHHWYVENNSGAYGIHEADFYLHADHFWYESLMKKEMLFRIENFLRRLVGMKPKPKPNKDEFDRAVDKLALQLGLFPRLKVLYRRRGMQNRN